MLRVRTNNPRTSERGTIKCKEIVQHPDGLLSCVSVDTISGENHIVDYHHGTHQIDVLIPMNHLSTVKAIRQRQP